PAVQAFAPQTAKSVHAPTLSPPAAHQRRATAHFADSLMGNSTWVVFPSRKRSLPLSTGHHCPFTTRVPSAEISTYSVPCAKRASGARSTQMKVVSDLISMALPVLPSVSLSVAVSLWGWTNTWAFLGKPPPPCAGAARQPHAAAQTTARAAH